MFATDKNIETIGELVETVRHYLSLQTERTKLDVAEKGVRLITTLIIGAVIVLLLTLVLIYLSFAASYAVAMWLGSMVGGFAIVGLVYLVILMLVILFRKTLIEKPLVKFLASIILE